MRLALFDDLRLGVVSASGDTIKDITGALPWPHQTDALAAGWWRCLCRDFDVVRPSIEAELGVAPPRAIEDVTLRAPVLNPGKVIATASNYAAHVTEMRDEVLDRVAGRVDDWLLDFDVFLKAPTSIVGPADAVVLPAVPVRENKEIHHESELALVIGRGGTDIPADEALDHVLGYTIGLDMTVRGNGDRSRRKSYDTFTPIGPWIVTADEIGDPGSLDVALDVGTEARQRASTADLLVDVPGIVAYASSVMTLVPGDVILTGAPPGVGAVAAGETLHASISRIGAMDIPVRAPTSARVP